MNALEHDKVTHTAIVAATGELESDANVTASQFAGWDPPGGTDQLRVDMTQAASQITEALSALRIAVQGVGHAERRRGSAAVRRGPADRGCRQAPARAAMIPKKLLAFTLGTLPAIGGFIDIGDLVADAVIGDRFGLRLAWVTVLAVIGIACYAEMSARIAIRTRRPAFDPIHSRLGPRYALLGLAGGVRCHRPAGMAELSGVALALQLATSVHYLLWLQVVAAVLLVVVWTLPFETMERVYGLPGLTMLVYVVAVWYLAPDWSRMWSPAPVTGESWPAYRFFIPLAVAHREDPAEGAEDRFATPT